MEVRVKRSVVWALPKENRRMRKDKAGKKGVEEEGEVKTDKGRGRGGSGETVGKVGG